jgi:branched-chain amino acid transport system permease protein
MFIPLLIGALLIGSIYGLIALGFSLIYKASGLMTFTQGEILMLGAFLGLTFYRYLNVPFILALLITVIIMFLVGLAFERAIIRKLVVSRTNPIYIVLATIGLSIALQNFSKIVWGSQTFRFPQIFNTTFIELGDIRIQPESVFGLFVSLLFMVLLHFFMKKTKYGTAMRAATQDPMAATVMGINVYSTTGITWGISCVLAAIAGLLISPLYGCNFNMGSSLSLKGFAAAVIGGYGNMYGAIVGGLCIGFIETFTSGYISSTYKDIVTFLVMVAVLAFRPSGIFNEKVLD